MPRIYSGIFKKNRCLNLDYFHIQISLGREKFTSRLNDGFDDFSAIFGQICFIYFAINKIFSVRQNLSLRVKMVFL